VQGRVKSLAEFAEGEKIVRRSRISCFSVAPQGARKAIQIDLRKQIIFARACTAQKYRKAGSVQIRRKAADLCASGA